MAHIPLVSAEFNTLEYSFFEGKTIFHGSVHSNNLKCLNCKSRSVTRFGQITRTFKTLPVGGRKVELVVQIPRLRCKDCGSIKQPHLEFADPKKHYTRSLKRFVIDLCRIMSIQNAAELTGLSWDTVKDIHKRYLRRKYKSFNLKKVRNIAIDEVYLGKKRKYITLVLDLGSHPIKLVIYRLNAASNEAGVYRIVATGMIVKG